MSARSGEGQRGRPLLRLESVSLDRVEFALLDDAGRTTRYAVVRVASGTSWREAVRFPSVGTDSTASTGDEQLDRAIRDRAAEELVRLEATLRLNARRGAA